MSTIYRWRSGSPSFNVTVGNLASDNSGIKKVQIATSNDAAFSSTIVRHTSGGTAESTESYVGTITFKALNTSLSGSTTYNITGTTVTWGSDGTCRHNTSHSIKVCEPATGVTIKANDVDTYSVWSTYTGNINLTRTFSASTSGTPYGESNATIKFTSSDTTYAYTSPNTYVVSTKAKLATLTSKIINRSKDITITGISSSAINPNADATNAAPTSFSDTAVITIKNTTNSLALSFADTHLYNGESTTATVTSTPHANGTGSIVYSNALTSITSDKTSAVTPAVASLQTNNTNKNTFTVTGKGGGIATISVSSNVANVGKNVSANKTITCSSLPASTTKYTYVNGKGAFDVSYDSISSSGDVAKATVTTTSSNTGAGKFTYNGVSSGTSTVKMASGATVNITCSSLPANTTINLVSSSAGGTSKTISFTNDLVASTDGSYFTYTSSSTSVSVTALSSKSATGTITMRSGATITVVVSAGTIDDESVELNVGDKRKVEFDANDSVSSAKGKDTFFTYTTASGSVTITARAAGKGSITLASGMVIPVIVKDISVNIS